MTSNGREVDRAVELYGKPMDAHGCAIRACFDPGLFTPRWGEQDEPLHRWQARAVLIALRRAGHTLTEVEDTYKTEGRGPIHD